MTSSSLSNSFSTSFDVEAATPYRLTGSVSATSGSPAFGRHDDPSHAQDRGRIGDRRGWWPRATPTATPAYSVIRCAPIPVSSVGVLEPGSYVLEAVSTGGAYPVLRLWKHLHTHHLGQLLRHARICPSWSMHRRCRAAALRASPRPWSWCRCRRSGFAIDIAAPAVEAGVGSLTSGLSHARTSPASVLPPRVRLGVSRRPRPASTPRRRRAASASTSPSARSRACRRPRVAASRATHEFLRFRGRARLLSVSAVLGDGHGRARTPTSFATQASSISASAILAQGNTQSTGSATLTTPPNIYTSISSYAPNAVLDELRRRRTDTGAARRAASRRSGGLSGQHHDADHAEDRWRLGARRGGGGDRSGLPGPRLRAGGAPAAVLVRRARAGLLRPRGRIHRQPRPSPSRTTSHDVSTGEYDLRSRRDAGPCALAGRARAARGGARAHGVPGLARSRVARTQAARAAGEAERSPRARAADLRRSTSRSTASRRRRRGRARGARRRPGARRRGRAPGSRLRRSAACRTRRSDSRRARPPTC